MYGRPKTKDPRLKKAESKHSKIGGEVEDQLWDIMDYLPRCHATLNREDLPVAGSHLDTTLQTTSLTPPGANLEQNHHQKSTNLDATPGKENL